jgi:hypothetical protein
MVDDLEVEGDPSAIDDLIRRLEDCSDRRWRRDLGPVKRLEKVFAGPVDDLCFSIDEEGERPAATLWIERRGARELVVSNIVPTVRQSLTDDEYHAILDDFQTSILQAISHGIDVQFRRISPRDKIEEALSREAKRLLRSFSSSANRSGLHPSDWRKWGRFLIQTHLDRTILDGTELGWWLDQEGWPRESRDALVASFETGLSLLAEYDEERVPS